MSTTRSIDINNLKRIINIQKQLYCLIPITELMDIHNSILDIYLSILWISLKTMDISYFCVISKIKFILNFLLISKLDVWIYSRLFAVSIEILFNLKKKISMIKYADAF